MAARRKKTETLRLEKGEGASRTFWAITRSGAKLTTRFGRYLSAGRVLDKTLASDKEAAEAFERSVAQKRSEGYTEPAPRRTPGESSKKGVGARNPEIEAIIDARPDDPEGYLVYADWLQQQGDVRGELIVVQHGLASDPDSTDLLRSEGELLKRFEAELLGPLAKYTYQRNVYRSHRGLSWRYGFLHGARLRRISATALSEMVQMLLDHPSARFLRRLVLGAPSFGGSSADLRGVFAVIADRAPKVLDDVVLGDMGAPIGDVGLLWAAVPRLASLVLDGQVGELGEVRAPRLQRLHASAASPSLVAAIAGATWPSLASLHLTLVGPTATADHDLRPLFAPSVAPRLERVCVRRWLERDGIGGPTPGRGDLIPQDRVALEVAKAAQKRGLARIDLDLPLSDAGAEALADLELYRVGVVAVPASAVTGDRARARLEQRVRSLEWSATPVERSLGALEASENDD